MGDTEKAFMTITDPAAIDRVVAQSRQGPVILFKHDFACSISAMAYRELSRLPNDVLLIDVERAKEVASAVAERTGVEHESPQVLILRDGACVWAASHFDIHADVVAGAVRRNA